MELWFDNGLVPKDGWEKSVDELKADVKGEVSSEAECIMLLTEQLRRAVEKRLVNKRFGIFLSGGVDSSLLALSAQKLGGDFVCYAVGFIDGSMGEPPDVRFARKVAEKHGFVYREKIFDLRDAERLIMRSARILRGTGLVEPVHVGVGAVVCGAVELAREDKVDYFLGGLGAEEIFAGYARHLCVDDVQKECWRGLREMWSRDLVRDAALGGALGVVVRTPFLDGDVIKAAMCVPGRFKVVDGERKVILRKVAESLWLMHEIAWRKKQAAQYGSGFDKAMEKLAKRGGFKTKGDYLRSL